MFADEAGMVARSHPVAAEFEHMMQVAPEPAGPEVPGNVPVETPPQPPDGVPGEIARRASRQPAARKPGRRPTGIPQRHGAPVTLQNERRKAALAL